MNENKKDLLKAAGTTAVGAGAGAGINATIGGIGVVAGGGAVGITLLPLTLICAGLALSGYGIYWLGKRKRSRSLSPAEHK